MQKKFFNFAIIAVLLSLQLTMIFGCMCGGPTTCDENGNSATNETGGVCDCCPSCNTCDQLLTGCMDSRAFPNLDFEPSLPSSLIVGVNISHLLIINNSTFQGITLGPVCVDQILPEGLNISYDSFRMGYFLEGTPTKIQNATSYVVRATGNVGYVGIAIISLEVSDPHGEAAAATTANQPASTSEITSSAVTSASEPITTSSITSSSVTTSVESVTTSSVSTSEEATTQSAPVTTANQAATTATQPVTTATQPVTTSRSRSSTTARSVTTAMKTSTTSKQSITTQVMTSTSATGPNNNNNISTGKNNISTGPSQPQQATTARTLPSTPSPTIPLPEVPTSSSNIQFNGVMLLLTISIWMLI